MTSLDDLETHDGVSHDRQAIIQRACVAVRSRAHLIIAGDILLDRRAIVADVVTELRESGHAVIDTTVEAPGGMVPAGAVVVIDLAMMTPDVERWSTAVMMQRGVTILLATASTDPASTTPTLAHRLRAAHAVEISLQPLSPPDARALVVHTAREHGLDLAPIEITWMVAVCAGSAPLLRALVQDYAESDDSSVAVFGRRTRIVATEALTEVPVALLPIARLVASLPGISRRRLRRFVDARALDLLTESSIADRVNDRIIVNQTVVLALHLTAPADLDEAVVLVASDVMASLALGTTCEEAEVLLVATLLREHPQAFAHVPWPDRSRLLFVTMWLLRRAGATDRAAFAARQLMTQPGWEEVAVLREIARGQEEDLAALSADIRANRFPPEAYAATMPWVQCLSLPLTRDTEATRWAVDLTDAPTASASDGAILRALRTVLRAAQAVQDQNLDHAVDLATGVLLPQGAHDATRLRAIIILGAVASLSADGPRVERFVKRILGITLSQSPPGITHDLTRRGLDDALLLCALTLASLGAPVPSELLEAVDKRTHAAAVADDHPALIRMAITRLVSERDSADTMATVRFLGRLNRTDLSSWVLSRFGGDPAQRPMHLVSGTFMDHALSSASLLSTLAQRGPEALAARWDSYPTAGTPFRAVCEAYLDRTVYKQSRPIDITALEEMVVPENALLGAVRDHVIGLENNDPETLSRALHTFITNHAWECARIANRDLAELTANDPTWAKRVKASQRLLQSEMRTVAAAQSSLTPRERQITMLASQGMRNKEIADELFVSVRTVESHLYRALHKLSAVRDDTDGQAASPAPK